MNLWLYVILAALIAGPLAQASEDVDKEAQSIESTKDNPEWNSLLKEKYNLSDEQVAQLQASGVSRPQAAMAAEMAKRSGKTIDEILKMRSEQKMGWGKIAKDLGLPPGVIGQSVAEMRHRVNKERHEERMERRQERRQDRREDRREERREKRQEKRNASGKGS